jgi:hypothetical protein
LREDRLRLHGQYRQKQAKGQFNAQRTVDAAYPHVMLQNCGSRQMAPFSIVRRARLHQSWQEKARGYVKTRRWPNFSISWRSNYRAALSGPPGAANWPAVIKVDFANWQRMP